MSRTKVDKELMSAVTVKIAHLYSKIKRNPYQSCTLGTLLPKLLSGETKVLTY
jgi:hypothetical protein